MRNSPANDALETLTSLTVGDVMNRTVVTIAASQPMCAAAQQLREHDVSCAPVVDSAGRCVGILSATDFLRRDASPSGPAPLAVAAAVLDRPPHGDWAMTGELDNVEQHMSRGVQSISAQRSVLSAARMMCDGHLHRLVVLDSAGRPEGMVSTMDVISALLNTLDAASISQLHESHTHSGSQVPLLDGREKGP